jgi:hypothetical protein
MPSFVDIETPERQQNKEAFQPFSAMGDGIAISRSTSRVLPATGV